MPHYKDGKEAFIGDYVTGKCYNTTKTIAGTIISITKGVESCNAMVQFTTAVPIESDEFKTPKMAVFDNGKLLHTIKRSEAHQTSGDLVAFVVCNDYCSINELTKII
jgi:IMP cyclohydrolase